MGGRVYFILYEGISRAWYGWNDKVVSFFAGGFAGATAWASVYPVDGDSQFYCEPGLTRLCADAVIKTRWTTAPLGTYSSLYDCYQRSVAKEGWRVLYKGFGATMARAWPQNAVLFLTYEQVKAGLKPRG